MGALDGISAVILAAVLVLTLLAILKIPVKLIGKLIINTIIGFIALFLINAIGAGFNISIAVNWINAVLIGAFGVAGVALILLLNWLFIS